MKRAKSSKGLLFLVIVVLVIAAIVWIAGRNNGSTTITTTSNGTKTTEKVTKSDWQAVLLNVGDQLYVGKISDSNDQFVLLRDAFRVQVVAEKDNNSSLKIVRVSEGIHGPTNDIRINRDSIAIIEDLRSDSSIIAAVENYDKQKGASVSPTPTPGK